MNQIEIAEQLKDVPDQYLLQEVQQPTGNYPAYLVVSEMTRRKRMRQAAVQPAPTTTVVEDLAQGAAPQMPQMPPQMPQMAQMQAPSMGLGGLPQAQGSLAAMDAGAMPEERVQGMAGGGMVSFKQGGEVNKYADGDFVSAYERYKNSLTPVNDPMKELLDRSASSSAFQRFITPSEETLYKRAKADELMRLGFLPSPGPFAETTPAERAAYKQRENLIRQLREGQFDPMAQVEPAPQAEAALPDGTVVNKAAYDRAMAGKTAQTAASAGQGSGTRQTGSPSARQPAFAVPYQDQTNAMVQKYLETTPMTQEQLEAQRVAGMRKFSEEMPDRVTPMMQQEIATREGQLGKEKSSNLNMALMQAGLSMMGNRSQYGMQAVGQGGLEGLKAYREGKKDIQQGEADLAKAKIAAAQAESLYEQGKYAAGDKAMDRASDFEAKGLAKLSTDIALMTKEQDRAMAINKYPLELEDIRAGIRYKDAIGAAAGNRAASSGGVKLSDADQKAAEDAAKMRALMTPGVKFGSPEYFQLFNTLYSEELQRRAAGAGYMPSGAMPAAPNGAARFLGFE